MCSPLISENRNRVTFPLRTNGENLIARKQIALFENGNRYFLVTKRDLVVILVSIFEAWKSTGRIRKESFRVIKLRLSNVCHFSHKIKCNFSILVFSSRKTK